MRRGGIKTPYCGRMEKWEYLTAPLLIHNTKMILDTSGTTAGNWSPSCPAGTRSSVAYFERKEER